ncbi:hypothetical protein ACJMK2_043791 [Sinanodonta woodiana]|uniref:Ig-like domain-containing protein n=1 Tax=Sinanodonta woodiana TaxID=1069815 RepID=A0ABD3W159_SINWO
MDITMSHIDLIIVITRTLICAKLLVMGISTAFAYDRRGNSPYPEFLPSETNVTFNRGSVAQLPCSVANLGTKTVSWRRHGQLYPLTVGEMTYAEDSNYDVRHIRNSPEWNLMIKNVQPHHAGIYECQVSTKDKELRKFITLNVLDNLSPKPDIKIYGKLHVDRDMAIVLVCNATGSRDPADNIDWFKDGQKLHTDADRKIEITESYSLSAKTITSRLRISSASMDDTGTYICRVSEVQVTSVKVNVLNADKSLKDKRDHKEELHGKIAGKASIIHTSNYLHLYAFVCCCLSLVLSTIR